METSSSTIIAYLAIACVIVCAIYFQMKFMNVDSRTRQAEQVSNEFTSVLKGTASMESLNRSFVTTRKALQNQKDKADKMEEDVDSTMEELEFMKQENLELRKKFNELLTVLGKVEGVTIPSELALTVEPSFPITRASVNHHQYEPMRRREPAPAPRVGRGRVHEEYSQAPAYPRAPHSRGRVERPDEYYEEYRDVEPRRSGRRSAPQPQPSHLRNVSFARPGQRKEDEDLTEDDFMV